MSDMTKGFTSGAFDLFHAGHLHLLQQAAAGCDHLTVGVAPDDVLTKYKGQPPTIPFKQRLAIVAAIKGVSQTIPFTWDDYFPTKKLPVPCEVIFCGDDYQTAPFFPRDDLITQGIKIVYLPRTPGVSTSIIKQLIRNRGPGSHATLLHE